MRTGSVHRFKMENHNTSPKFVKTNCSSEANGMVMRCSKQHEPFRIHQSNYGEEPKDRGSDKSKIAQKRSTKEQTRPTNIKLHTQQRAVERAGFNYLVASKLNYIEQQRQQEEKIQKMIEEEEIRMMRKEMIPRAQLMPFFDRPFFPQRSTRPLTIPREPSFHICSSKCWRCISCCELYSYHEPRKSSCSINN